MRASLAPNKHARRSADNVPVLMYHSISIGSASRFRDFVVRPDEFAVQMAYLDAKGYSPITAAEMLEGQSSDSALPARPIVLTFDDAYTDFYTTVLPVLRRFGFSATIYVPTAYVGGRACWLESSGEGRRELLSWQALCEVAAEGIEVASHSHSHPQLDRVPNVMIWDEIHRSKCLLEDKLGSSVRGFAYPFGYWNRAARAAVADAEYQYAFAVSELITTRSHNPFALPRLSVRPGIGVPGLAELLASRSTPTRRHWAEAKRILWRGLRAGTHIGGGDP
jgi:peptidoglycan/xylan/chitin deacetylase (PgdA/CDA1 family)